MTERAVDQPARDLATQALAAIDRHEAVCEEAERRRSQQIADMRAELSGWLERIQKSYEAAFGDISTRHSNAMVIVNGNVTEYFKEQKKINEKQDKRYWALLSSYAFGMTAIAGALAWAFVVLRIHG